MLLCIHTRSKHEQTNTEIQSHRNRQAIATVELVYREPTRAEVYIHDIRFWLNREEVLVSLDRYEWDVLEDALGTYIANEDREHG